MTRQVHPHFPVITPEVYTDSPVSLSPVSLSPVYKTFLCYVYQFVVHNETGLECEFPEDRREM